MIRCKIVRLEEGQLIKRAIMRVYQGDGDTWNLVEVLSRQLNDEDVQNLDRFVSGIERDEAARRGDVPAVELLGSAG